MRNKKNIRHQFMLIIVDLSLYYIRISCDQRGLNFHRLDRDFWKYGILCSFYKTFGITEGSMCLGIFTQMPSFWYV